MSNRLETQYRLPFIADPEYAIQTSSNFEAGRAGARNLENFATGISKSVKTIRTFTRWTSRTIGLALWMKNLWALSDEELAQHGLFRDNIGNLFVKACRS
ncbi:MAG: hypothetical protein GKS01_06680 [Alphaproteobacteria bacterium]|nr:hypothetical protein [Alphaproteobacteria bacterium]